MSVFLPILSGCPSLPSILPSGLVIPSMLSTEPFGLNGISALGLPFRSTYWVAICPDLPIFSISAMEATSLPLLWDIGTIWIFPIWVSINHGELLDTTLTWAILDTCLPILLQVSPILI